MIESLISDKHQLINFFKKGEVAADDCKIGLECEIFAVNKNDLNPVPYHGEQGIHTILKSMVENFEWEPVYEESNIIGLKNNSANITLEPAGQLELSGTACIYLEDCISEYNKFISQLSTVCNELKLGLLPIGYHPVSSLDDTEWVPKNRYKILSKYFTEKGDPLAHHMMKLTTTVQVSIDYCSENDFREKMLISSYLVPLLTAVFANSPLKNNCFSGYLSYRNHVWENTDKNRCGIVPQTFNENFSYEDYVDYLLDVPMIMRISKGNPIPMHGRSFYDYWKEGNATMDDWELHTSFAFPDVRVKNYIEIRTCDNQRPELVPSIPALIKGIFYSQKSRNQILTLFKDTTANEITNLKKNAAKYGLNAMFRRHKLLDMAQEVYKIAKNGLEELIEDKKIAKATELEYLTPLEKFLFHKKYTPAEEFLNLWKKSGKNVFNIKEYLLINESCGRSPENGF